MVSLKPCQRPLRPPGLTYFFLSDTVSSSRGRGRIPGPFQDYNSRRSGTRCRCINQVIGTLTHLLQQELGTCDFDQPGQFGRFFQRPTEILDRRVPHVVLVIEGHDDAAVLDLILLAPDLQERVLSLESVDGVEPLSGRAFRPVVPAPSWV